MTIFGHAQWAMLFQWMEALPAAMIRSRPRLEIQYAWALLATGHWEAADVALAAGISIIKGLPKATGRPSMLPLTCLTICHYLLFET
jgi:ATP/maltotriose-dependent transcriptional regulator MalT